MVQRRWFVVFTLVALASPFAAVCLAGTPTPGPEATLTVAVATFGNERWLPQLYVGAEDVVFKPMYENLLSRDPKTGELIPLLAERWEVLDGGRTWRFYLRKGISFHGGQGEMTAEDVKFTFATLAKEGSANGLAPEFRLIKSMEVDDPYTLTLRFEKPFVTFGNKVTQGLFASSAFIHPKKVIETMGEEAERHPVATGPWKFVEHIRGDRIVYEAVENHWRATPHFKRLVFLKVPEPATRIETYVLSTGAYAYGGYADIDELFRQQSGERDRSQREALLHQIQRLMHERVMHAPIYEPATLHGVGPRVEEPGVGLNALLYFTSPYEEMRLKRP